MIAQMLLPEVTHEYANTRKILERVPLEHFSWKPHEKSMTLERLATHITALPQWITIALSTKELDFSKRILQLENFSTLMEMVASFDKNVDNAKIALQNAPDEAFAQIVTLKRGEQLMFTIPVMGLIRSFAISHIIHHRAQLQVYLRMLNVPVPGFYGPSADEL